MAVLRLPYAIAAWTCRFCDQRVVLCGEGFGTVERLSATLEPHRRPCEGIAPQPLPSVRDGVL